MQLRDLGNGAAAALDRGFLDPGRRDSSLAPRPAAQASEPPIVPVAVKRRMRRRTRRTDAKLPEAESPGFERTDRNLAQWAVI